MPRYLLELEFDGAPFCGWQKQSIEAESTHSPSIQMVVHKAIQTLSRQELDHVRGCGRTDAGVHALQYFCDFFLEESLPDIEKARHGLNGIFPPELSALSLKEVASSFHSIKDVRQKTYEYRLLLRRAKDTFDPKGQWWLAVDEDRNPEQFDLESLYRESRHLLGTHDFGAFASSGHGAKSTVRSIDSIEIVKMRRPESYQSGLSVSLRFRAKGFLRRQVRNMVGALVAVAGHRKPRSYIPELLKAGDGPEHVVQGIPCAPAHGLYLRELHYLREPGNGE